MFGIGSAVSERLGKVSSCSARYGKVSQGGAVMDRFGRVWLVRALRGMEWQSRGVRLWYVKARLRVAVSEGNGSVLWGLARMCGAWQYWTVWVRTGEARSAMAVMESRVKLMRGLYGQLWIVQAR